jgi:UDP-2,3-diacylglucosamine hydrolase
LSPQATLTQNSVKLIGLVAGEGKLPEMLARSAKEKGYKIVALALSQEALLRVESYCEKVHLVAPGQLNKNYNLMKNAGVRDVVFIGKIPKLNILQNLTKVDWWAVRELSKLPNLNDDTIQRAMGDFLDRHDMRVLSQSDFLRHLFPEYGLITKRQPTAAEYADIDFGFKLAKEVSRLDIGQTVVVKDQMIMAIEAIEGTDEAIRRGANLSRGPMVVVKVAKENRDERFDTPTVGMSTLEAMVVKGNGGVLAVEAGHTLIVDQQEMVAFAEANGIAIIAV